MNKKEDFADGTPFWEKAKDLLREYLKLVFLKLVCIDDYGLEEGEDEE